MQPRQRMPMGGMGPFMMGPPGNMGGRFGNAPMQSPFQGQMMGAPHGQMRGRSQRQGNNGGGILSKILGKGNQAGGAVAGASRAGGAGAGGILKSLSNPGAINGLLNNTQQVIKTAQTIGPMVQQYGPLVKNIPAMWKLYRGLKDAGSQTEQENTTESATKADDLKVEVEESSQQKTTTQTENKKRTRIENKTGNSIPKLYI